MRMAWSHWCCRASGRPCPEARQGLLQLRHRHLVDRGRAAEISALSLAQIAPGYLWVGTQSGLARFDGVRFLTFSPEDVPALPGIWVRAVAVRPT
jgi:hypothetical protein